MNRLTMCGAAAVIAVSVNPAAAQVTKTIPGEAKNLTVTVEAIDHGEPGGHREEAGRHL